MARLPPSIPPPIATYTVHFADRAETVRGSLQFIGAQPHLILIVDEFGGMNLVNSGSPNFLFLRQVHPTVMK